MQNSTVVNTLFTTILCLPSPQSYYAFFPHHCFCPIQHHNYFIPHHCFCLVQSFSTVGDSDHQGGDAIEMGNWGAFEKIGRLVGVPKQRSNKTNWGV